MRGGGNSTSNGLVQEPGVGWQRVAVRSCIGPAGMLHNNVIMIRSWCDTT